MTYYLTGFFGLVLMLGACNSKGDDTPQPNDVPANLLATTTHDSVITVTEKIDFSTVSATGQGPTGSLIRWDTPVPTNHFKVFTYDQKSRLVNTLEVQNGLRLAEIARYQGGYLAESYMSDYFHENQMDVRVNSLRKYKYDATKQLKQIWHYGRKGSTNTFQLNGVMDYEYDSNGQLTLLRTRFFPKGSYSLMYWEKGDCVRVEEYVAPTPAEPNSLISQINYSYDKQSDPKAQMPLYAVSVYPPSKHFVTRTTAYRLGAGGSVEKMYETATDYQYVFDKGQLITMRARSLPGEAWTDWGINKFTYAP